MAVGKVDLRTTMAGSNRTFGFHNQTNSVNEGNMNFPQYNESKAWAAVSAPALLARIKNIILSPKTEWPIIEPEPTTIRSCT